MKKLNETLSFLKQCCDLKPESGLVLGSGLGSLIDNIDIIKEIKYSEIPNFPVSTVKGHSGKLIFAKIKNHNIVALQGRFHYYEGYDLKTVTYPIRVLKMLGIKRLFLSNTSGGVNTSFKVGDIMIIEDHINLLPGNPLRGKNIDSFGPRFPDMSEAYDKKLIKLAQDIAKSKGFNIKKGVYAVISGPNYETKAEFKFLNIIGADAVGMSTVPEVIVARHMNIPCFAISIITDIGITGETEKISHEEVLKIANKSAPVIREIIVEMLKRIS